MNKLKNNTWHRFAVVGQIIGQGAFLALIGMILIGASSTHEIRTPIILLIIGFTILSVSHAILLSKYGNINIQGFDSFSTNSYDSSVSLIVVELHTSSPLGPYLILPDGSKVEFEME